MAIIKLTNSNEPVIVDDEDLEYLSQFDWLLFDGYVIRRDDNDFIRMHRELMSVTDSSIIVDHVNRRKLDNRKSNLRLVTKSQNMMNSEKKAKASSKYKGVRLIKNRGYYQVRIQANKTSTTIGHFYNEVAGANAYNYYAKKLHGEFAVLNDVPFMKKDEWKKHMAKTTKKRGNRNEI